MVPVRGDEPTAHWRRRRRPASCFQKVAERGGDDDDAGRCRSDARPRSCGQPVPLLQRKSARLSHGGRDRCRLRASAREAAFRFVHFLSLPEMEAAKHDLSSTLQDFTYSSIIHSMYPPRQVNGPHTTTVPSGKRNAVSVRPLRTHLHTAPITAPLRPIFRVWEALNLF